MRAPSHAMILLAASLGSPAWAQNAAMAAAAPAPAPSLSQTAFDPAPYLGKARWTDGCYGVSMAEPAGMKQMTPDHLAPAHWLFEEGQVAYSLEARFVLPIARNDKEPPRPLSFQRQAAAIFANAVAGQGTSEPLPAYTRDFIADKHPCTVAYALVQPLLTRHAGAPEQDSFLVGVGVMQVNPRCHLALTMICRIPAGTTREWPALVDAQRRLEATLGSVRTTPEATLAAVREAQLERGEICLKSLTLARIQAALSAFGPTRLLRVTQDGRDAGWAQWDMRHQDDPWYQTHPVDQSDVDSLRQAGLKTILKLHMESEHASADTVQTCFHSDQSIYEAWQRTTTWRQRAAKTSANQPAAFLTPQSASETGYLTHPPGLGETARLKVEWAGSTPAGLAHFFSTEPHWREKMDQRWSRVESTVKDHAPDAPIDGHAIAAGADDGKNMSGDLSEKEWGVPLDPRRPYLSQAQAWLMPWLLPADCAQSYAFCFYSQEARHPGICLFKVAPHEDGSRTVFFRPALDQAEQAFDLDGQGRLLRIVPTPGLLLVPSSTEELARIWHIGGPQ